jgi:hypothetical protein
MTVGQNPDADSLRLELQEALATFRNWVGQTAQAFGILATGDALLVTYGFSQRLAAILFLGSILPIGAMLLYIQIMPVSARLVSLAVRIERKLSLEESLALTVTPAHFRTAVSRMANVVGLSYEEFLDLDEESSKRHWLKGPIPTLLYATAAIQVALAVLGLTVYGYKFM